MLLSRTKVLKSKSVTSKQDQIKCKTIKKQVNRIKSSVKGYKTLLSRTKLLKSKSITSK